MAVDYTYKNPKKLLTPASGYLTGYSHTLNPYTGCSFACSYCYVRELPVARFREGEWGTWVDVKSESASVLQKELRKASLFGPISIFMSSATDPYQPIEVQEQITRSLLAVMVEEAPDFLFVQTRSPLVTRDIDLFLEMKDRIRISMTIETDQEEIRRAFTPEAPPVAARLKALEKLVRAGLPVQATIAPLLPSTPDFAKKLSPLVNRVCLDDFFMGDGSKGKRTERLGIRNRFDEMSLSNWYQTDAYRKVYDLLLTEFAEDQVFISQDGFLP